MAPFGEFWSNFCVATSQSWGSSPDRSPIAQWLNMRISPASCLPAPRPLPPSLCLQGSIQNPCPARRWREAPCGAGGFQKSQYWPEFPSIQNPCPGRRWRQAPCGGEGFQKSQYWPKFPSIPNPCLARCWWQAPCGGEGFQKSQYWPKLYLSPVIKVRDTREGSQAKYERNVKGRRGN